jgi:hypothetical protein
VEPKADALFACPNPLAPKADVVFGWPNPVDPKAEAVAVAGCGLSCFGPDEKKPLAPNESAGDGDDLTAVNGLFAAEAAAKAPNPEPGRNVDVDEPNPEETEVVLATVDELFPNIDGRGVELSTSSLWRVPRERVSKTGSSMSLSTDPRGDGDRDGGSEKGLWRAFDSMEWAGILIVWAAVKASLFCGAGAAIVEPPIIPG